MTVTHAHARISTCTNVCLRRPEYRSLHKIYANNHSRCGGRVRAHQTPAGKSHFGQSPPPLRPQAPRLSVVSSRVHLRVVRERTLICLSKMCVCVFVFALMVCSLHALANAHRTSARAHARVCVCRRNINETRFQHASCMLSSTYERTTRDPCRARARKTRKRQPARTPSTITKTSRSPLARA